MADLIKTGNNTPPHQFLPSNCKVCLAPTQEVFIGRIRQKYDISYFFCSKCGFLQTEEPYWLEEAYKEPICISDTGILTRNIHLSANTAIFLYLLFDKNDVFLDYAGGYGIFTRLMRDKGFNFLWYDLYAKNIFARGFEYSTEKITAVTSFESFEHFVNPLDDIKKILAISRNLIFSTELLPENIPRPTEWWYYGLDSGQHISFYSKKTLAYIAGLYNLNFYSFGGLHLFLEKKLRFYQILLIQKYSRIFSRIFLPLWYKKSIPSKTFSDCLMLSKQNYQ